MHELSIALGIVKNAEDELRKVKANLVDEIEL
ncbi:MAG: hydrogenase maturation nickel metallochaperone HypA [Bacteroidia bacterium]|nr:hydrogenase maturation nickel metallochaperone HypA [Bacteroidia bacterium]